MSLVAEQARFLEDICLLVLEAKKHGFVVTGGEFFRTPEQQALHVKAGRSQTMFSQHMKRLAFDLNFFKDGKLCYDYELLKPLGQYWESLDSKNRWGGNFDKDWSRKDNFKDLPHFERQA